MFPGSWLLSVIVGPWVICFYTNHPICLSEMSRVDSLRSAFAPHSFLDRGFRVFVGSIFMPTLWAHLSAWKAFLYLDLSAIWLSYNPCNFWEQGAPDGSLRPLATCLILLRMISKMAMMSMQEIEKLRAMPMSSHCHPVMKSSMQKPMWKSLNYLAVIFVKVVEC